MSKDTNIIYRAEGEIKNAVDKLKKAVEILNENWLIIQKYNKYLTPKIAYLHSFIQYDTRYYYDTLKLIKIELTTILDSANPFNSPEIVDKYATDLNRFLHLNAREDGRRAEDGQGGNIRILNHVNYRELCDKYISFNTKTNKFEVSPKAEGQLIEKYTMYTANKKQQKLMAYLHELDEIMDKIKDLGFRHISVNGCLSVPYYDIRGYIQRFK